MLVPRSIEELQTAIQAASSVKVVGGGTKPAMSESATMSTRGLNGVLEYEPSEYTFTALAGTPLRDIAALLGENGQFLPFDPPLIDAGATVGGTVAAGLSGPGRYRYGGVRDFLLGVRMVSGAARVVFGGGKVVKNAAGFDLPKLMVGGLGRWGVLAELTFKVFPAPEAFRSLKIEAASSQQAMQILSRLAKSQFELSCLDWEPPQRIWVRLGGLAESLQKRMSRLQEFVKADVDMLDGADEAGIWHAAREFAWVPHGHALVKMPLVPQQIEEVEDCIRRVPENVPRRYSVGGNVAWIALPVGDDGDSTSPLAHELPFPALALRGKWKRPWIGAPATTPFARRLLSVFDPEAKCTPDEGHPSRP